MVVVGVVVAPAAGAAGVALAAVPCGSSVSVYRVPSAVLTSVTGVFTLSVIVELPLAYEPPATATFAVVAVRAISWNTGLAAGKFDPAETDSLVPFTEITAAVGGALGGAGGVLGGLLVVAPPPEDEDEEPPDFAIEVLGPPELNGSLLSKSENDWSCPFPADACTASMSWDEPAGLFVAAVSVGSGALSDGAAGNALGVVGAATGAEPVVSVVAAT